MTSRFPSHAAVEVGAGPVRPMVTAFSVSDPSSTKRYRIRGWISLGRKKTRSTSSRSSLCAMEIRSPQPLPREGTGGREDRPVGGAELTAAVDHVPEKSGFGSASERRPRSLRSVRE